MAWLVGLVVALATAGASVVLVTLAVVGRQRTLALAGGLLLSLGLFQASTWFADPTAAYLVATLAGAGTLALIGDFLAGFWNLSLGPGPRWVSGALWGAYLSLCGVGLDPGLRAAQIPAILVVFFGSLALVVALVVARAGALPPLHRRFLRRFALVGGVGIPLIVLDIVVPDWGNWTLPALLVAVDALVLVEARRWTAPVARPTAPAEAGLTEREADLVRRIVEGASAKEIAVALALSPKTVENYTYRIYQKLGVRSRLQLYHRVTGAPPRPSEPRAPNASG